MGEERAHHDREDPLRFRMLRKNLRLTGRKCFASTNGSFDCRASITVVATLSFASVRFGVAEKSCIDLLRVHEDGSADWVGRVETIEEAQPKLDKLSAAFDSHFLAVERSSARVVAHVMGRAAR
jgi:hypothetical protein